LCQVPQCVRVHGVTMCHACISAVSWNSCHSQAGYYVSYWRDVMVVSFDVAVVTNWLGQVMVHTNRYFASKVVQKTVVEPRHPRGRLLFPSFPRCIMSSDRTVCIGGDREPASLSHGHRCMVIRAIEYGPAVTYMYTKARTCFPTSNCCLVSALLKVSYDKLSWSVVVLKYHGDMVGEHSGTGSVLLRGYCAQCC
jgi:hypothetical protein